MYIIVVKYRRAQLGPLFFITYECALNASLSIWDQNVSYKIIA